MQDRQSAFDHPRSDDVKGRQEGGYEDDGGFGDRGYGDRGDFGDEGIGPTARRETGGDDAGTASTDAPGAVADAPAPAGGGYADQADYGDLPRQG